MGWTGWCGGVGIEDAIAQLRKADAGGAKVIQTHLSIVFVGRTQRVLKLKKPVQLGFVDLHTVELRRVCCHDEVRLNRRLAPDVYLGVRQVLQNKKTGTLKWGELDVVTSSVDSDTADERVVEFAVEMVRLPDECSFQSLMAAKGLTMEPHLFAVAHRLAEFHGLEAERSEILLREFGGVDVVCNNMRENFEQTRDQAGTDIVSQKVWNKVREESTALFEQLVPVFERRVQFNRICDTHGDLRLEHCYWLDVTTIGKQLVIIDCVEFNNRFRIADPVADVAFLVMELCFQGRRDLADQFFNTYSNLFRSLCPKGGESESSQEMKELLKFYVAYRAIVRAKVAGIKASEPEVDEEERRSSCEDAQAHWLFAQSMLATHDRLCVVLVGGLPGTGKSVLCKRLVAEGIFELVLRADVVRKELATTAQSKNSSTEFGGGIYTSAMNDTTYNELARLCKVNLRQGSRVLIDASFREDSRRKQLLTCAVELGVPCGLLILKCGRSVAHARITKRQEAGDDPSDANIDIYERAARSWQPPSSYVKRLLADVDASGSPNDTYLDAIKVLNELGLCDS